MPVISVLIASLRPELLKKCLASIHGASQGVDYEVVVVCPFDIPPHDRVVHVKEEKVEGNYNAVAKGYPVTRGEYVVVLSDDVLVVGGSLREMVAFMRPRDEELFQGRFVHTFTENLEALEKGEASPLRVLPLHNFFGYMFSGFPCMRKDKIDRIGGLFDNKRYRGFWGDADLGIRVWVHGGRIETCTTSALVAYPNQDELDTTSKAEWQKVDEKVFCQLWEPIFDECFSVFDVYGMSITCPKCDKVYRWRSGDHRQCWYCNELVYPLMFKGGKDVLLPDGRALRYE